MILPIVCSLTIFVTKDCQGLKEKGPKRVNENASRHAVYPNHSWMFLSSR